MLGTFPRLDRDVGLSFAHVRGRFNASRAECTDA
jgi:hypothetical protein